MSRYQRFVLLFFTVAVLLSGLFPPWRYDIGGVHRSVGFHLLFSEQYVSAYNMRYEPHVEMDKLAVEWMTLILVSTALVVFLKNGSESAKSTLSSPQSKAVFKLVIVPFSAAAILGGAAVLGASFDASSLIRAWPGIAWGLVCVIVIAMLVTIPIRRLSRRNPVSGWTRAWNLLGVFWKTYLVAAFLILGFAAGTSLATPSKTNQIQVGR